MHFRGIFQNLFRNGIIKRKGNLWSCNDIKFVTNKNFFPENVSSKNQLLPYKKINDSVILSHQNMKGSCNPRNNEKILNLRRRKLQM